MALVSPRVGSRAAGIGLSPAVGTCQATTIGGLRVPGINRGVREVGSSGRSRAVLFGSWHINTPPNHELGRAGGAVSRDVACFGLSWC